MIVSIWANTFAAPDLSAGGSFAIIFKSSPWLDATTTKGFYTPSNGANTLALSDPAAAF